MIVNGSEKQKKTLGRGLSALIHQASSTPSQKEALAGSILQLPIESILRDFEQPRKAFDLAKLQELAESIKIQGLIQPILVRKSGAGYKLIAGERRWRAAQLAGLLEVPALVREVSDAAAFELALVENLQREDLNPVEEADGYRRLIEEFSLTQEQVSQRVGKERSSIANSLRLLALPDDVKQLLVEGSLNMGQARALLGAQERSLISKLALQVVAKRLSVRETEQLVRREKQSPRYDRQSPAEAVGTSARQLSDDLQRLLGTKVRVVDRGGKGTLEIDFFSYQDLDRILAQIRRN